MKAVQPPKNAQFRQPLPGEISLPGFRIKIIRKRLHPSRLGYWDERRGTVVVSSRIDGPQAHVILLHELLHACETALLSARVIRVRPPHDFIESLAPNLLLLLAGCGLWRGVSLDSYMEFYGSLGTGPTKASIDATAEPAKPRRRREK